MTRVPVLNVSGLKIQERTKRESDSRNDKLVISVLFSSHPDAKETTLKCLNGFKFHRLIVIPYTFNEAILGEYHL